MKKIFYLVAMVMLTQTVHCHPGHLDITDDEVKENMEWLCKNAKKRVSQVISWIKKTDTSQEPHKNIEAQQPWRSSACAAHGNKAPLLKSRL